VTHAIVLVQAERAAMPSLGSTLADLEGVREVYSVTGEWDFVVIVAVQQHDDLADVVTKHVTQVEGVARTQTMVAFQAFSRHDLEALFSIGAEPESQSGAA
jgi:DNA-binding Lrp family transcriptional regulator